MDMRRVTSLYRVMRMGADMARTFGYDYDVGRYCGKECETALKAQAYGAMKQLEKQTDDVRVALYKTFCWIGPRTGRRVHYEVGSKEAVAKVLDAYRRTPGAILYGVKEYDSADALVQR